MDLTEPFPLSSLIIISVDKIHHSELKQILSIPNAKLRNTVCLKVAFLTI